MGFSNIKYFTMRLKTKDSIDKAVGRVLLSARITKQSRSDIISHAMSFVPLYKFLEVSCNFELSLVIPSLYQRKTDRVAIISRSLIICIASHT